MINIQSLDKDSPTFTEDKELLEQDGDRLRNFYSLTGPPRRDYIIQLAQAEAERIKIIRQAQAEGILAIRQAEAKGPHAANDLTSSETYTLLSVRALYNSNLPALNCSLLTNTATFKDFGV